MNPINEINVTVDGGVKDLVIRQGEAAPIPVYHGYKISGASIEAVQEYLKKSEAQPEQIHKSYATFSYEELYLKLLYDGRLKIANGIDEGDHVEGLLKLHPELEKWKINNAKAYDNESLSRFIKMNRHFFEDSATAMKLVSELQNIQVKSEREYQNADNKLGDYRKVIGQRVIESNIPQTFVLKLPVFVGQASLSVPVEIEINPTDWSCSLISPKLKEIIDLQTKVIIDEQLDAIRKLYPELRIYQK